MLGRVSLWRVIWTKPPNAAATVSAPDPTLPWMARRPADLVGLTGKGRLAVGADADLVAFDPDATFVVDPQRLHHRNPVTPYAGRELSGVVTRTWLRGRPVTGHQPGGRFLIRQDAA